MFNIIYNIQNIQHVYIQKILLSQFSLRKFYNNFITFFDLRFEMLIPSYAILEKEYQILEKTFSKMESPIVYAHNDLLLGNILYNQKQETVAFIDYEYTAFNYQAFDIVNHFLEFAGNYIFLQKKSFIFYRTENVKI